MATKNRTLGDRLFQGTTSGILRSDATSDPVWTTGITANNTHLLVGANVIVNTSTLVVGNSTVNVIMSSSGLTTSGIAIRGVQVGDIIVTLDSSIETNFVELDGSTLTDGNLDYPDVGARYSWMISGNNLILPDFRGRVLRSWAHGSSNDPDRATRTARAGDGQTGDYPGTYQADGAPDITGYGAFRVRTDTGNIIMETSGCFTKDGSGPVELRMSADGGSTNCDRLKFNASNSNARYGALTQVAPININVTYQMRVL